jgi:alpha/beta superfamily hydrolase
MLLLIIRFSTSAIFCSYQSFLIFSILVIFFTLPLHQVPRSSAGDSTTQSSVSGDSFASVIKYVIRSLEDNPTQKELHAEASQTEERPPTVTKENVPSVVTQQDISKQPTTYVRRAKKQKQVCVVIIISAIHFYSKSFIKNTHTIADFDKAAE